MGRPNRIQFAGACYHVMLQGNNRQELFQTPQDRRYFLSLLKTYKERYELKVYAYCLMANYVHLLIETELPNLSKVMQGFNTSYTKYFNQQHETQGHVFQGRYKALLVDKETYLLELTRYVHLAPVRDGLKEKPWRYPWSSCPAYVEAQGKESLVDTEPVLKRFAKSRLAQSVRYLQFIKERSREIPATIPTVRGLFVGSQAFADAAAKKGGVSVPPAAGERDEAQIKAIITQVLEKHGVDEERLFGRSQWREICTVRKEAIYRIWKEAKLGVTDIGRLFNRTPSAVSQLIRAMETSRFSNN